MQPTTSRYLKELNGFYPAQGRVEIRLTAEADIENELEHYYIHLLKLFSDWLEPPEERSD